MEVGQIIADMLQAGQPDIFRLFGEGIRQPLPALGLDCFFPDLAVEFLFADDAAGELIGRIQRGESSLELVVSHLAAEVLGELERQEVESSKRQDRAATARERSSSNPDRPDGHRDEGTTNAKTEPRP